MSTDLKIPSAKVINCKVANIRPEFKNLKDWCDNKNNVYIARGRVVFIDGVRYPFEDSIWANPFKIDLHNDRKTVIAKYRKYITNKIANTPELREELLKLKI